MIHNPRHIGLLRYIVFIKVFTNQVPFDDERQSRPCWTANALHGQNIHLARNEIDSLNPTDPPVQPADTNRCHTRLAPLYGLSLPPRHSQITFREVVAR